MSNKPTYGIFLSLCSNDLAPALTPCRFNLIAYSHVLFLTSTELFVTASVEATDRRERTELMIERFICSENVEKEEERDEIAPPSPKSHCCNLL